MCIVTETNTQNLPLFAYVTMLDNEGKVVVIPTEYSVMPKRCITEFTNYFELIGDNYEDNNHRQNYRRTYAYTSSNSIRSSGEGSNNSELSGKEDGTGSNRVISTPQNKHPKTPSKFTGSRFQIGR